MARLVPAVSRALQILDLFGDGREFVTMSDVAAELPLPRTTAHELLRTLAVCGYLRRLPDPPQRFSLGVRNFELGSAYAARLDLLQKGQEVVRRVAAACSETVQMAVLEHTEVLYIAKVDSTRSVRLVSSVGRRLPAHCTGPGKMLLSGLSDQEVVARHAGGESLPAMTPNSITTLDRLLRELAEIRARGIAFDNCESNPDVCCVAGPVHNHEKSMVSALSVSVPVSRMNAEWQAELIMLVRDAAHGLSIELGYP